MNYQIIEREAFRVVGKSIRVNIENKQVISNFWNESNQNGFTRELGKISGPLGVLGVCTEFNSALQEFSYYIASEKMNENSNERLEELKIPASTWAIFESIGPMPGAIQQVWDRIYSEWFPTSGYEHAFAPEMEVYPEGDVNDENYRCEVWIPVVKK